MDYNSDLQRLKIRIKILIVADVVSLLFLLAYAIQLILYNNQNLLFNFVSFAIFIASIALLHRISVSEALELVSIFNFISVRSVFSDIASFIAKRNRKDFFDYVLPKALFIFVIMYNVWLYAIVSYLSSASSLMPFPVLIYSLIPVAIQAMFSVGIIIGAKSIITNIERHKKELMSAKLI